MTRTRTRKAFRNPIHREAEARALTDPRPTFVSLVKAGANQTPLRVIKAQVITCKEHREMTDAIQRARSNGFEIQQIQFRKSEGGQFSGDEPINAVRAWLEQGGYMVDAIEEDDEHFLVKNDETEFEEGTSQQIELDDVVVTVARVKGADAPQRSDEDRQREHAGRTGSAIIHKEVRAKDDDGGSASQKGIHHGPLLQQEDASEEEDSEKGRGGKKPRYRGMRFDDGAHELLTKADCEKHNVPEGSRYATKFEVVDGVCGQGFVSVSVDGALICVPMGNTEGYTMEDQPAPAAASGGQGSAGFGGTAPAHPGGQSGQESNTGEVPAATASVASPAEGQGNAGPAGTAPAHGSDGGGGRAPVAPAGGNAPSGGESGGGSSFAGSTPVHATRTRTRTKQATPSAFGAQNEAEIDEAYHGDAEAYDRETDKPGRNVPSQSSAPGTPVPSPLDPNTAERVRSGKVITFKSAHADGATKADENAVWNAAKELAFADVDDLAVVSAWRADKEELTRGDFAFAHHQVAKGYPVVYRALSEGIDRLNGSMGGSPLAESDRQGVYRHLSRHVREDFGKEPAKLVGRDAYLAALKASNERAQRSTRLKGTLAARFVGDSEIFRDQPEARQRFDEFMAMFSDGTTLSAVMKDAEDGMPPGLMEVILAMVTAVRNNIMAGDVEGVRAVANEFGEITAALTSLFDGSEGAQRAMEFIMPHQANPWWDNESPQEDTEQQETQATRGEQGSEETGPEQTQDSEALMGVLRDLSASVKEGLSEIRAEVHAVRDDLDERVTELETSRRHTRRSADDVEIGQPPKRPEQEDVLRDVRLRGALGITNGSNGYGR